MLAQTDHPVNATTDSPPQWGRINEGQRFNMTAADVERALSRITLGKNEKAVFLVAKEAWTNTTRKGRDASGRFPDSPGVLINCQRLANTLGVDRQSISRAKRNLIRSRLLVEAEPVPGIQDRPVRVNKHGHEWLDKHGLSRLSEADIEFCLEVQPKSQGNLFDRSADPAPPKRTRCSPRSARAAPPEAHALLPLIEEPGRGDFLKIYQEDHTPVSVVIETEPARTEAAPPVATPLVGHRPPQVPEGACEAILLTPEDRAELEQLSILAESLLPNAWDIVAAIGQRRGNYPANCYGPALEVIRDKDRSEQHVALYLGIVRRFATKGIPDRYRAKTTGAVPIIPAGLRPEPEPEYWTVDPALLDPDPARKAELLAKFRNLNGPRPDPVVSRRSKSHA